MSATGLGMNAALQVVGRLGPARLGAMAVVAAALVAFFAFVILRVTQPALGVLFAELGPQEAGAILRELDTRGVRYEVRADGQTILAPRADLPRLRMEFAAKGLPSGGGIGYEIFDKGDAFSATSFVQSVNHLRALEGELARTIRAIGRVQGARVHLVIPERRLFERDREAPSASIVLRLGGELDPAQVRAVRHVVASAVQGLKPERISIVDERGRLLADGAQGDLAAAAHDDKQAGIERRLKAQVEEIVASAVGPGRARVQVAAELDFNRVESRSESYDPESRVVRSTQSRTENQSNGTAEGGPVSVGNELPGANAREGTPQSRDASSRNEETTNYEISRTTRTEVLEGGRLKRLSIAVLVDGDHGRAANGDATYRPRSAEDLERIGALVRTAVGFDRNRGDQIEVVNMRFAAPPPPLEVKPEGMFAALFDPGRDDVLRFVELAVVSLLVLLVLLTVVRPLLRRVLGDEAAPPLPAPAQALPAPAETALAAAPEAVRQSAAARLIDAAKASGQIQAQALETIGEMVSADPKQTVAVLRSWMNER